MRIDNNVGAMISSSLQIEQSVKNISKIASEVSSPELQEVSVDLVKEITDQIPQIIAYEMNANAIKIQNEVLDSLLDIKA